MKPKIETEKGWSEVVIDSNCVIEKFYKVANILHQDFNLTFTSKIQDFDTIYWNFQYKEAILLLHYNIYIGIMIFPIAFQNTTKKDNELAVEIGTLLFEKL